MSGGLSVRKVENLKGTKKNYMPNEMTCGDSTMSQPKIIDKHKDEFSE